VTEAAASAGRPGAVAKNRRSAHAVQVRSNREHLSRSSGSFPMGRLDFAAYGEIGPWKGGPGCGMTVSGIERAGGSAPAWLPLRPATGSASPFADALRSQIRAELLGARPADGAATTADSGIAARAAALQRSLLTSNLGADAANYAKLTRSIGGQYLAP